MKKRFMSILTATTAVLFFALTACDESDAPSNPNDPTLSTAKILIIEEGALILSPGSSQTLTATLVSFEGEEDVTSKVQWSENSDGASFQANTLQVDGNIGTFMVTAFYPEGENIYNAAIPVNVQMPSASLVVAPAGILVFEGEPDLQLNTFFLGKGTLTGYEFTSSNDNVASVSSTGLVSFIKAGECVITISTKGIDPVQSMNVPVLIMGDLDADFDILPITRITLTPPSELIYMNDKLELQATAYNSKGEVVTPEEGFTWTIESVDEDAEDDENPAVGTISPDGETCQFSADGRYGRAKITAEASGIRATAEIFVSAEFVLFIDPRFTSMNTGESKQFAIETYAVNKQTQSLESEPVANPTNITWQFMDFGMDMFSIGSVTSNGNVTIKQDALPGMFGLLMAYTNDERYAPGVSTISVAQASDCNCGTAQNDAADIDVDTTPVNLSFTGQFSKDLPATVVDDSGTAIAGAQITYCTSNEMVASVTQDGTIMAGTTGTATITVCHGNLSKQITVTVDF